MVVVAMAVDFGDLATGLVAGDLGRSRERGS
jgi:hypothetical protein